MAASTDPSSAAGLDLQERVVEINRVAKVVKGGRRFSFTALVVVGDENDIVGVGYGKANEVPLAIQKGVERAKKNLFRVPQHGSTITHQTIGIFGSGRVFLKPASPGTGVIAGGGVRAVLELAGIHDILSKSLGTQNPINLVKATIAGPAGPAPPEEVAELRGLSVDAVLGLDRHGERRQTTPTAQSRPPSGGRGARGRGARAEAPRPQPRRPRRRGRGGRRRAGRRQVKSANGANAAPARHAALARACARSATRSSARTSPQLRGMVHAVRHLVKVEEDRAMARGAPSESLAEAGLTRPSACTASSRPRRQRAASASAAAQGSGTARRPAAARRAAARARAPRTARASRAARCRSTCGCASCAART